MREEEEVRRLVQETNMARFQEYYAARNARGGGRGRGPSGRGRASGGRGYSNRDSDEMRTYQPRGHRDRELDEREVRPGRGGRGRGERAPASGEGRRSPNEETGISAGTNQGIRQTRRGRGGRNPGRGGRSNGRGGRGRSVNEGETTEHPSVDMESDTPEIANAVRRNVRNPYPRSAPPSGFNPVPQAESAGRNDNTTTNQQPQSLPIAQMRSNNASQDDEMPVGRVIGTVGPTPENRSFTRIRSAHEQNVRATQLTRMALQEARRDSMERLALSRAIYNREPSPPTPPLPSPRRMISQEQINVIQCGTLTTLNAPSPSMEILHELAARSPLSADPYVNVWANENGYLVFDNMRTYSTNEAVVITQEILTRSEQFNWDILSPLPSGQKWDVAASIAAFKTAEHNGEPPNRHALFVSGFFATLSMSTIEKVITKPEFARRLFRKHQGDLPFVLSPETSFPLINSEMYVPSMLTKLKAQVLCPVAACQALRMYTTRLYPYHQLQLINEIDTNLDPTRIHTMLNTPGAFHDWALEVVPQAIFRASNPVNIEYIQERIDALRDSQLEEESILEIIENEGDMPELENAPNPPEYDPAEASATGVTQGVNTAWRIMAEDTRQVQASYSRALSRATYQSNLTFPSTATAPEAQGSNNEGDITPNALVEDITAQETAVQDEIIQAEVAQAEIVQAEIVQTDSETSKAVQAVVVHAEEHTNQGAQVEEMNIEPTVASQSRIAQRATSEERVQTVSEATLNRARNNSESVVLSGTQGAPLEVEGFRVSEYLALEAPETPPIELFPQDQDLSAGEQYRMAIDEYITTYYKLAVPILRPRLEGYNEAQLEKIATSKTKLEIIIQSMELKLYTPKVRIEPRANGRYYVPLNDTVLSLPNEEYTFLLQFSLNEGIDPLRFISFLQLYCKIFNPEHEMDITEVREVLPNLTEKIVTIDSDIKHPIRIRFTSSFCFKTFLSINGGTSYIRTKWNELNRDYVAELKLHSHRPMSMKVAAIMPGILPEHGLEAVKTAISSIQSLLLSSDNDIAIDWSNEGVMGVSTENFVTLYAKELTQNILRNVCEIPLRLPTATTQPIKVHEINDAYHSDVITSHTQRMQECTVYFFEKIPAWANIYEMNVIPPMDPAVSEPTMSIGNYIRRLQMDGTIGDQMDQVFVEALNGNAASNFIAVPSRVNADVERLLPMIVSRVQECFSGPYTVSVKKWPEDQDQDQTQESTVEQEVASAEEALDQEEDPHDNETLFSRSQAPVESATVTSSELTVMVSNISKVTEKLLDLASRLEKQADSTTAPLTSVQSSGTNSQGASTSLSSESTLDLISQAVAKALSEAHRPNGCMHHDQVEEEKKENARMVKLGEEVVVNTMSVLQESVHKSIDNSLPIIQDEIRDEIRDSTAALRKLITAPTREFSGETAMAVNTLLTPKFDSMISLVKQLAVLTEISSMSPANTALGDPATETSSAYKVLRDILQSIRNMQYEISKGYEILNSLFVEVHTIIARESRRENEKEAKARGYFRNLRAFKELFHSEALDNESVPAVEQVLNYIETTSQLHALFESHFNENGGDSTNAEEEKEARGDTESLAEEVQEETFERKSPHASAGEAQDEISERKSPHDHVIQAECVAVAIQEHYESNEEAEESQIEMAKALSILECIPEGKPPALSEDEFKKQQALAMEQESLERQLRNEEEEKIRRDVEAMGISTVPSSPKPEDDEEIIPGTPKQRNEPTIVTPKEPPKQQIEEIIIDDDREVSNLTAPSNVMAGPNPEAPYQTDESTVTSEAADLVDQTSVASATRAMPPRSCKKTKSSQ